MVLRYIWIELTKMDQELFTEIRNTLKHILGAAGPQKTEKRPFLKPKTENGYLRETVKRWDKNENLKLKSIFRAKEPQTHED